MTLKFRYQNPIIGDTIRLRLDTYNSNNFKSVNAIDKIEIFFLDSTARTPENPDGRTLVSTVLSSSVVQESEGQYYIDLITSSPLFVIGNYLDIWHIQFEPSEEISPIDNIFQIFPDLWITSPIPIVYDFAFRFTPSQIVRGSKKHIRIEVVPMVPRQTDLMQYYENLAIAADITVSIEQTCGECLPEECDLRLIVDNATVDFREKSEAFFFWDTTDLETGIYSIWCCLQFGGNVYISPKHTIQLI